MGLSLSPRRQAEYHRGDTNTYIRFIGSDDLQLVAGGRQMLRMDEGTDPDRLRFVTDNDYTDSSGNWTMSGNVTIGGTIDTGQGATEVYLMNQNVRTVFFRYSLLPPQGDAQHLPNNIDLISF